jgi:hypothetical protein
MVPAHQCDEQAVHQSMDDSKGLQEVRFDLLRRLAEQAMSDPEFRAVARHDLAAALATYGYDLNERELLLVMRFRDAVAEAGVDLFLDQAVPEDQIALLLRGQP